MGEWQVFEKERTPWNKGTGGCKRGHDATLYICQPSGIFVCLGCKRENNALYKKRQRGELRPAKVPRDCACGCGGHPRKGQFLPGHNRKSPIPIDRRLMNKLWRDGLRILVLAHYGRDGQPVCMHCGFTDVRALSLDHIKGNGNLHRRTIKKWLYLWLKQEGFPEGYQTLCMNCQMIKAHERHERPGPFLALESTMPWPSTEPTYADIS